MVNSQEAHELLIIFNILVCIVNGALEVENVALLACLALEKRLESRFALRQLFKLCLIRAFLALGSGLCLDHVLSADECLVDAL
jgi:hypothetical protein